MEKKSQRLPVVILTGRTGVGKSYLSNKIAGREAFLVSSGQGSVTSQPQLARCRLGENGPEVILVDTPGFGDTRPGRGCMTLMKQILSFLKQVQNEITICLYCSGANDRMVLDELKLLGDLLGSGLYKNTFIVKTKTDTLKEEERAAILETAPGEIGQLLKEHYELEELCNNRVLISDAERFDELFMNPLIELVQSKSPFKHSLSRVNFDDPQSMFKFLEIPEFISFLEGMKNQAMTELRREERVLPTLRLKNDNNKVDVCERRIKDLKEASSSLDDLLSKQVAARKKILELACRSSAADALTFYLTSRAEDKLNLYNDIVNILSSWKQSNPKNYHAKTLFRKDALQELQLKVPIKIQTRIKEFLEIEINNFSNTYTILSTPLKDKVLVELGWVSVMYTILGTAALSITFQNIVLRVICAIYAPLCFISAGLFAFKVCADELKWEVEQELLILAHQVQTNIAHNFYDDILRASDETLVLALKEGMTKFDS